MPRDPGRDSHAKSRAPDQLGRGPGHPAAVAHPPARRPTFDDPRNVPQIEVRERCRPFVPDPGVKPMSVATRAAGLLVLSAVSLAPAQPPADKKDDPPATPRWTILFRSDDPTAWNKDAKGPKGE